jgi:nitronate monooxygenase
MANRFLLDHSATAPAAYPEIHHVTSPLRAAARKRGDAEAFNLWAGQAHQLAQARPAAEIVRQMCDEAREAVRAAGARLGA